MLMIHTNARFMDGSSSPDATWCNMLQSQWLLRWPSSIDPAAFDPH